MMCPEADGFLVAFAGLAAARIRPRALFCAHDGLAVTAISELLRRIRLAPSIVERPSSGPASG